MRKISKTSIACGATLLILLFASSCATTSSGPAKVKGVACPQCRVVVAQRDSRDMELYGGPAEARRHYCPGCDGALTSLLKEGKLKHRCSICEESPYTCDVAHAESLP